MQSIKVNDKNVNIKIEKYLQVIYPKLSYGVLQRAFRKKDIKADGIRIDKDYVVKAGDLLEIYISDEFLNGTAESSDIRTADSNNKRDNKQFSIVYEDDNILIVNKNPGIPVHPDREQPQNTLIDLVREYLREKNDIPANSASFQPSLCHRLDRNTGGLIIIAKNQESLDTMLEKIELREVRKYYQCVVKGKMERSGALLKAYLWKDADKSRVFVNGTKKPGSYKITTGYRVIEYLPDKDISLLEVELITGRTHQIRAHLAYAGHPVIGDGKYGINAVNRSFGIKRQALWAYSLKFDFKQGNSILDYLSGKEFHIKSDFGNLLQ